MAIRGHTEGGADAIVVAGGDAAIGKRLIDMSSKYRLVCGMLSDLDDFDRRSSSAVALGGQHGGGDEDDSPGSRGGSNADEQQRGELQHLVRRTDEMLRQVYDAMPENGLFIISAQGGVHAGSGSGIDELCAADNAAALLAIKM